MISACRCSSCVRGGVLVRAATRLRAEEQCQLTASHSSHALRPLSRCRAFRWQPSIRPIFVIDSSLMAFGVQSCRALARHPASMPSYAATVPIRIVLADDHYLVREGVLRLLEHSPISRSSRSVSTSISPRRRRAEHPESSITTSACRRPTLTRGSRPPSSLQESQPGRRRRRPQGRRPRRTGRQLLRRRSATGRNLGVRTAAVRAVRPDPLGRQHATRSCSRAHLSSGLPLHRL